jgi:hypothetical protein
MGYTTYYNFKGVTQEQVRLGFDNARKTLTDILKRYEDMIQYEYDDNAPAEISRDGLRFNGIGEDGYETFVVANDGSGFNFCKTANKHYDIVVCECLLVLKCYIPHMYLGSDGFYAVGEDLEMEGYWEEAIRNVERIYGIKTEKIMEKRTDSNYTDITGLICYIAN